MNIVKVLGVSLFATLACLLLHVRSTAETATVSGESPYLTMNSSGDMIIVYIQPNQGLNLAVRDAINGEYSTGCVLQDLNAYAPIIKQDKFGELWIAWEKEADGANDIYFSKLRENGLTDIERIAHASGYHMCPDFDFDQANDLWITWISMIKSEFNVCVKNTRTEKCWVLNHLCASSANSPKIIVDSSQRIWVFWAGRDKGRDEIFYSFFEGSRWSPQCRLNREDRIPHVLPSVALGPDGWPRIIWSAYDGHDYEIFWSQWDGSEWSPEEKVTDNLESDFYPILSFFSEGTPVVVWSKPVGNRTGIFCTYRYGGRWSEEKEIVQINQKLDIIPQICTQNNRLGVIWQEGREIKSTAFTFIQLEAKGRFRRNVEEFDISASSFLKENTYIGFGDSITEGWIDYLHVPHLGYVPRLESLLYETYGPSKVINAGWGGEITANGLTRMPGVISENTAGYLLLMEGTNDVVFRRISMDTTAFNLKEMILTCRDNDVFVVLSTIMPRNDKRWHKKFFRDRIFELNDKIRNLAADEKVPLMDIFDIFYTYPESDGGWLSLISDDKVHPSIKGYQLMAESWFIEIMNLPFPPSNVKAERFRDQIENYVYEANQVSWQDSPKISDISLFKAYAIYREDSTAHDTELKLVKTYDLGDSDARIAGFIGFPSQIKNGNCFLDFDIEYTHSYRYIILLIREDDVEGPSSFFVEDDTLGGTGK